MATITSQKLNISLGSWFWLVAMTIMAGFQTWRGAYLDGIIFAVLVLGLLVDAFTSARRTESERRENSRIRKSMIWGLAGVATVILVLAPRHEFATLVAVVIIGVGMLVIAWLPRSTIRHQERGRLSRASLRSIVIWSLLGVLLCVWEATAFVLSVTTPAGIATYPTVSVLLDPVLEQTFGRIVFVSLWLLAGVGLIFVWRKKS